MAGSPACTAPGSIRTALIAFGSARLRSTRRDGRWATCSATRFVSAWRTTTYLSPAKASRPCCRYAVCFRPCRWPLHFRPITSRPWLLSSSLRRLYIARDADAAGDAVQTALAQRAGAAGIEAIALSPRLGDFNEDLHVFGLDALRAALRIQLAPEDVDRFLSCRPPSDKLRLRSIDVDSSVAAAQCRRGRDHGLLEGDRTASGPGRQWLRAAIFRRAPPKGRSHISSMARFASRSKIAAPPPSSAGASALRCRFGFWPVPPAV